MTQMQFRCWRSCKTCCVIPKIDSQPSVCSMRVKSGADEVFRPLLEDWTDVYPLIKFPISKATKHFYSPFDEEMVSFQNKNVFVSRKQRMTRLKEKILFMCWDTSTVQSVWIWLQNHMCKEQRLIEETMIFKRNSSYGEITGDKELCRSFKKTEHTFNTTQHPESEGRNKSDRLLSMS